MLAQHCSREEFFYTLAGFQKKDLHIVVGYQNFLRKNRIWFLPAIGAIPKYLYGQDTLSVRKMLRVIQRGESLLLYPEGIQSTSGSTQPINPATIKLLKKCGLPVVLCSSQGAYLTRPRYSSVIRHGQINYHYQLLFTPQELAELSENQIYDKLLKNFRYNDFDFNQQFHIAYHGKVPNITGLNNIIFRCPICEHDFCFQVEHDTMTCTHCGLAVTMDAYYQLHANETSFKFTNINQWYQWQRQTVHRSVNQNDFTYTLPVQIGDINLRTLAAHPDIIGTGTLTLTHEHLIYKGTYHNQNTTLTFDLHLIPSLPFDPILHNVDMVYNNQYYCFMPTANPLACVQLTLMIEELHNRIDPAWRKVCEDVYDY